MIRKNMCPVMNDEIRKLKKFIAKEEYQKIYKFLLEEYGFTIMERKFLDILILHRLNLFIKCIYKIIYKIANIAAPKYYQYMSLIKSLNILERELLINKALEIKKQVEVSEIR